MTNATSQSTPRERSLEVQMQGYDQPFCFKVTLADFHGFQREVQKDVPMAMNNFLLRTSTEPDRLRSLFVDDWGLPSLLMEPITSELVGLRSTTLKNSSGA